MSEPITHIIITGGAGYIGSRLAQIAAVEGKKVVVLKRLKTGQSAGEAVNWKLGDPLPECDVPWHSTAIIHLAHDWNDRDEQGVNYQGTCALLESARACGVARFVFCSSQSARVDAPNAYGRIKWTIEQLFTDSSTVSARIGLVYGGQPRGLFALMRKLVKFPLLPMVEPERLVQPIHIDEVCRGLLRLADNSMAGRCGLATPNPVAFGTFLKTLAREMHGYRLRIIPVPLDWALRACDAMAKIPLMPRVDKERILGLTGVRRMDCAADMQALGIAAAKVEQGIRQSYWGRRALLREGKILCSYVLGGKPGSAIIRRYAKVLSPTYDAEGPLTLQRLAGIFPWLLRFYEPLQKETRLSFRLHIAATLVENTPQGARAYYGNQNLIHKIVVLLSLCGEALVFPCRLLLAAKDE